MDYDEDMERVYQELVSLSSTIRQYDAWYYYDPSGTTHHPSILKSDESGDSPLPFQNPPSDEEYDALVLREAQLCQEYPHLLQRLETETQLGSRATRYGGRVGPIVVLRDSQPTTTSETSSSSSSTSSTLQEDDKEENVSSSNETTTTSTVASSSDRFALKQRHGRRMLSLDNLVTREELGQWLDRVAKAATTTTATSHSDRNQSSSTHKNHMDNHWTIDITTEPKIDGLSLSLRYTRTEHVNRNDDDKNNTVWTLQWAATRGDGQWGQDVTATIQANAKSLGIPLEFLKNHPLDHEDVSVMEIRGEVVFPTSVFRHEEALSNFSNPRNAASGILLRKDDTDESRELQSNLRFYAYDMVLLVEEDSASTAQTTTFDQWSGDEIRQTLEQLGFILPRPFVTTTLHLPPDLETLSNVWNDTDISGMLGYLEQLKMHREKEGTMAVPSPAKRKSLKKGGSRNTTPKDWQDLWGDYEMDGCVHKVDNATIRTQMGETSRAPRWAVAHKFPAKAAVTRLVGLDVQVGRTGVLTPVAVFEPVTLDGVTVKSATLHNFGKMREILLENGGDAFQAPLDANNSSNAQIIPRGVSVMVRRSGDVIPQVFQRVGSLVTSTQHDGTTSDNETISLATPQTCPACGSPVEQTMARSSTKEPSGQIVRCTGPMLLCEPRALGNLQFAFARDAFNVKGLSESRLRQLREEGLVQVPSDLFRLTRNETEFVEKVSELHGWGEKSALNLAHATNKVATEGVSLSRFIFSLGVPFVGKGASEIVASVYKSVDAFLLDMKNVPQLQYPDLESFPHLREENDSTKGIGPALLESLVRFSLDTSVVQNVLELRELVHVIDEPGDAENRVDRLNLVDGPLKGMNVVFTGKLEALSRNEAQDMAKQMGATKTSVKVTKATDLVVAGEKAGSKLSDAQSLGICVMDANEFVELHKSQTWNEPSQEGNVEPGKLTADPERTAVGEPTMRERPLQGMKVVFSGSLGRINREKAQNIALQLGATSTSTSVTKLTDLVVIGSRARKNVREDAEQLGITVMEADEFLSLAKSLEAEETTN